MSKNENLPRIDIVVPVYNEERELQGFLDQFSGRKSGASEAPLRLIIVDNGSSDASMELVQRFAKGQYHIPTVLLSEPVRSVVQARIRGADFSLKGMNACDYPVLVSADADTRYHPGWISDIRRRFSRGQTDALGYRGSFPAWFWRMVPDIAYRYYDEIGTVFFPDETIEFFGFDVRKAMFTEELFLDFPRLPSDHGFAITKAAYRAAGGYRREFAKDGHELLQESWNLIFRLSDAGGRYSYVSSFPCAPSPRRLVFESQNELTEQNEQRGTMSPIRQEISAQGLASLSQYVRRLDFDSFRRIVVRDLVIMPSLLNPSLLHTKGRYFIGIADKMEKDRLSCGSQGISRYARARDLADSLAHRYHRSIVHNLRQLRAGRTSVEGG